MFIKINKMIINIECVERIVKDFEEDASYPSKIRILFKPDIYGDKHCEIGYFKTHESFYTAWAAISRFLDINDKLCCLIEEEL